MFLAMEKLEFLRQFPIKSFDKGGTILSEGDLSNALFEIQTGYIKITSLSASGVEHLLWIAGPTNIVPAEQLFSTEASLMFFYTALSDCTARKIDKAKFLEEIQRTPALMTETAVRLSTHFDDLLQRVDSTGQVSVRGKLIHTLCHLARRFGSELIVDIYKLDLRLTHQDIAELIGSTRETTSIELRKLFVLGCIDYDRNHFLINITKLEAL